MKLIPKIILSLVVVSYFHVDGKSQNAPISKSLPFPELHQPEYEKASYKQIVSKETIEGRFRAQKVKELTKHYSPREVFIEMLRRAGKLKGDTLPPDYQRYYQPIEIKSILSRNQALNFLSDLESIEVYKQVCAPFGIKAIRGDDDDREEIVYSTSDLSNPLRKDLSNGRCVAAAIPRPMLTPAPMGMYKLHDYKTFQERFTLCYNEPYSTQPAAADFTTFAVNDSTLLTAGHCLDTSMLLSYYYVFDYIMNAQSGAPQYFPAANVFEATKVTRYYDTANNQDVCIVVVNKKIDNKRIVTLNNQPATDNNSTYYVIGTPGGIPLKLAGKAKLMENTDPAYFLLNSDTYKGNSGSPVFNTLNNTVEGLFISGTKDDFQPDRINITCRISMLCPFDACPGSKGEKVIRTSQFLHLIK